METSEQILEQALQGKLVLLTRRSIESAVLRQGGPGPAGIAALCREGPELALPRGAFVTIYVEGLLRGCLGEIEPEDPLAEVVARCARRVPVSDHRFPAVRPDELPLLTFKISVLSRPMPVSELETIQLGVHGLIVRHEGHAGLLLPEVPLEYGWDLKTFLVHLWRKAGISPKVCFPEARLWCFTSQIISSADYAESMQDD